MNAFTPQNEAIEPERYELFAESLYRFEMDRREFFKMLGGGIVVLSFLGDSAARESLEDRRFAAGKRNPPEVGAWIHVGENGRITVYTGKAELGQNIRTSLAQAVADELPAPLESIELAMADTSLTPYDAGTFGSQTTPRMSPQLRKAAAAAREILIDLAAENWSVNRESLQAAEGKILHKETNRSLTYGELAQGKQWLKTIPDSIALKTADQWTVSGRSIPAIHARPLVTGEHKFASDRNLPGMMFGKIYRPPAFGAKLKSADLTKAQAMKGVVVVQDGDFIGAAAENEYTASQAIRSIETEWERTPQISGKDLYEHLKKTGENQRDSVQNDGSLEEGRKNAKFNAKAEYTVAYIAHTPLEPRAALAVWEDGRLTVWTGTQRPFGVQSELARALRLPEDRVRVIAPDKGSGYGGKHTGETAIEAARLAKAAGRPVKVVWTREEEFTWAYFRPAGVIEAEASVNENGRITAWEFHNYNSGAAGIRHTYDIPNQKIEFHRSDSPLRQGSYRCLAATANHFARESFIDELANGVKMDPLEFRLKNTADDRFKNILTAAAERFGWSKAKSTQERGFGIAGGFEKGSYMAVCVEITIDPASKELKVIRAVEAFDCGPVINPNHLKNQIEGMIMMGLGGALYEAIDFEDGKILNARLSKYRVPRFRDLPQIECVLLDHKDIYPAGGGETPIVGIAPAIGNAIFSAIGIRLRSLPMIPKGLSAYF
ncbi:MAG: molybdopterin cofactor-binding domain-containing protein [Candidatus Omnitrophota bacterium]